MLTAIWDFLFHRHEWEVTDEGPLVDSRNIRIGAWCNLRCKKCGKIKRKNLV